MWAAMDHEFWVRVYDERQIWGHGIWIRPERCQREE
jgi:hypothetical protein